MTAEQCDVQSEIFLSVVIPVYRAERILPFLCERLVRSLGLIDRPYEIILVDDRSPDGSWAVLQELVRRYGRLLALRLSRNFGQHYAITAGLEAARGEWVVVMDCDLQDPPEEIERLLAATREGYDIVLARRIGRKDSGMRRALSHLFYACFALLSGYRMDSRVGSFRILHHRVVRAFCGMRETFRLFGGMIEWLGFRVGYVDVEHGARMEGGTTYNLRRMLRLAIDGIVSFSNRPLYVSIGLGLGFAAAAALYGAYLLLHYVFAGGYGVPGWLSTILLVSFIGGIILMNLGVIGVYVGRIYDQTKGRPVYVLDTVLVGSELAEPAGMEASRQTALPSRRPI